MTDYTERKLGWLFGLLGAALFAVAGIVALVTGAVDVAIGRTFPALGAGAEAILLFVIAGLTFLFARLGYKGWSGHPLTMGVLLVVVAVVGWAILGLGANLVALVGALFAFLAGILYLIEPAARGVKAIATS